MRKCLILASCGLTFALTAQAAPPTIELGREVAARALICDTPEKAEAIIVAHATKGIEEATRLAGATCLSAQFLGTPVLVLATRPLGDMVLKVVQVQIRMRDDSFTSWYMPTWYAISGGKEA